MVLTGGLEVLRDQNFRLLPAILYTCKMYMILGQHAVGRSVWMFFICILCLDNSDVVRSCGAFNCLAVHV